MAANPVLRNGRGWRVSTRSGLTLLETLQIIVKENSLFRGSLFPPTNLEQTTVVTNDGNSYGTETRNAFLYEDLLADNTEHQQIEVTISHNNNTMATTTTTN